MLKTRKSKIIVLAILVIIVIAVVIAATNQVIYLRKAHSTFDNYYAFRGCAQLLDKTDTYGTCETNSGQTIKIVEFNNRWYLDGDLPSCWMGVCL